MVQVSEIAPKFFIVRLEVSCALMHAPQVPSLMVTTVAEIEVELPLGSCMPTPEVLLMTTIVPAMARPPE